MDYASGNNFPFPEEEDFEYCKETMEQLSNGEYRIVRITEESEERAQSEYYYVDKTLLINKRIP